MSYKENQTKINSIFFKQVSHMCSIAVIRNAVAWLLVETKLWSKIAVFSSETTKSVTIYTNARVD